MLIKRQIKELLTYKQKTAESTSNDDSNTSKGQSDTNEVEKGITILTIIIIIIV